MYPKWVSRGHSIGQILCLNAEDEAVVDAERVARESPVVPVVEHGNPAEMPARKKPGPKPKVK